MYIEKNQKNPPDKKEAFVKIVLADSIERFIEDFSHLFT
jgi:hypothetical protein